MVLTAQENIALVGFRATGKSMVGRILAKRLGWSFVDMDVQLSESFGQDIHAVVCENGWEFFRKAEADLLSRMATQNKIVVATGGGVVLRADNREILKKHFRVFWLQASSQTIYSRITHDPCSASNRPSLTQLPLMKEIELQLTERMPLYKEVAEHSLMTDALSPSDIALAMETLLTEKWADI
jgi:shikimate kinase